MPDCPACGTALDGIGPQMRALDCPGCGHRVHVSAKHRLGGERLDGLLDAPSYLAIGRGLRLDGRPFRIAGRVRFGHDRGHRDEWWLVPRDGERGFVGPPTDGLWLEESEGRYLLHRTVELAVSAEALRDVAVGRSVDAGETHWLVTGDHESEVLGADGELPRAFERGARVRRLEAVGGGWRLSLELRAEGVTVTAAEPFAGERLELDPR